VTVIAGEAARPVAVPAEVEFSFACQVWLPTAVDGALAPGPPFTFAP
jgi:hypothetical protein